jgi:hypothetical protein
MRNDDANYFTPKKNKFAKTRWHFWVPLESRHHDLDLGSGRGGLGVGVGVVTVTAKVAVAMTIVV